MGLGLGDASLQSALERVAGIPRKVQLQLLEGDRARLSMPGLLPREGWRLVRPLAFSSAGREWTFGAAEALWFAQVLAHRAGGQDVSG